MRIVKNQKGMTLIEIVVTIAIIGIISMPFLSLFSTSYMMNTKADKLIDAKFLAQSYMERIQSMPYSQLTNAVNGMGFVVDVADSEILTFTQNSNGVDINITVSPYGGDGSYKYDMDLYPSILLEPDDFDLIINVCGELAFRSGDIEINLEQNGLDTHVYMEMLIGGANVYNHSFALDPETDVRSIIFHFNKAIAEEIIYVKNRSSLDIEFYCVNDGIESEEFFPIFTITEGSFTSYNYVSPVLSVDEQAAVDLGNVNTSIAYFVDIAINNEGQIMRLQGIKTID